MSSHKSSYEKWDTAISELKLKHRPTCILFSKQQQLQEDDKCGCGRLKRLHSYEGQPKSQSNNEWNPGTCSGQMDDEKNFGILYNPYELCLTKFIRCNIETSAKELYDLIHKDCKPSPKLIISIFGGAKYFKMNKRLEKEFMRGIIEAATTADGWILTTGLNSGIAKLVGEAISQDRILNGRSKYVVSIGFTKWGSLTETTRKLLSEKFTHQKNGTNYAVNEELYEFPQKILETNDAETIELHHTYMLLFDDGALHGYIGDQQRHKFVQAATNDKNQYGNTKFLGYPVTVIVEGGENTLQVIQNDLKENRPVVIIDGSGRMADVLSDLLKQYPERAPKRDEVSDRLKKEFQNDKANSDASFKPEDYDMWSRQITKIMDMKYRDLLNVYSLDKDINVAETIFNAIFKGYRMRVHESQNKDHGQLVNPDHSQENIKTLLDLSVKWNSLEGLKQVFKDIKREPTQVPSEIAEQFRTSIKTNKPMLVDYFLRSEYDVWCMLQLEDILDLYEEVWTEPHLKQYLPSKRGGKNNKVPRTPRVIDLLCEQLIGSFIQPFYSKKSIGTNIVDTLTRNWNRVTKNVCRCSRKPQPNTTHLYQLVLKMEQDKDDHSNDKDDHSNDKDDSSNNKEYAQQNKLRDVFLWSVFMRHVELAKVLLVHLKPRICAALIASKVFTEYSKNTDIIQFAEKMKNTADEFELYAVKCIDSCYEYNETKALELIFRRIPLFGDITCAQVAVSAKSNKFLLTACFVRVMNEAWYDKLDEINRSDAEKPMIAVGLLSFGVLAPFYVVYRNQQQEKPKEQSPSAKEEPEELSPSNKAELEEQSLLNEDEQLCSHGINYYMRSPYSEKPTRPSYLERFISFHESPMIKMLYDFIANVWLLLTFSYMMLYHFDLPLNKKLPHWSEIFVIITVTTILSEHIRQKYSTFVTNMHECENAVGSLLLSLMAKLFHIALYALFYTGIIMRHTMGNTPHLLTAARIIMAVDLELWYLRSLKFMMSNGYLGPKLLMIKTMTRDLASFLYIIFLFITAYGVVSRAMIMHNKIDFNIHDIFSRILYPPYSFLFGGSDKVLEEMTENINGTYIAETTATHVLLAVHMLFISILILNLLIAVFGFTINNVQENTEFYWQYHRYLLTREYFEKPRFSYPPLIILPHTWFLIKRIFYIIMKPRNYCCNKNGDEEFNETNEKVFKMIPKKKNEKLMNYRWDCFENAATKSYAKSVVENGFAVNSSPTIDTMHDEMQQFRSAVETKTDTIHDEMQQFRSAVETKTDTIHDEMQQLRSVVENLRTPSIQKP